MAALPLNALMIHRLHDECVDGHSTYKEVFLVSISAHQFEAIYTREEIPAVEWIKEYHRLHNKTDGARSLIAGVCLYPGSTLIKGEASVVLMSIGVGDQCLLVPLPTEIGKLRQPFAASIRRFLNDPIITVVGLGMEKMVKKLEHLWGFKIGTATELKDVVEETFQLEAVDNVGLEQLAPGIINLVIPKKPDRLQQGAWKGRSSDLMELKHASVDACFTQWRTSLLLW